MQEARPKSHKAIMASSFPYISSQTTLVITLSIFILYSPAALACHCSFNQIYAFGDSFTDTGNAASTTGSGLFINRASNPPYGRTFFHRSTNRYSDGRLVIDFVAHALSLPFLPPYLDKNADASYGVNFAVAGSTAIGYEFFVKHNLTRDVTPQSLQTQYNWFKNVLEGKGCDDLSTTPSQCKAVFGDALIWVGEIGANDYSYAVGSSVSSKTIQTLAIQSVTGFLQALLNKGAQYIVVQGLPTIGCLTYPLSLAPEGDRDDIGCVQSENKQSYTHNTILQAKLQQLIAQFPHATILYADYWNAYRTILKNANKYGLKELYKACCGSGGGQYNFNVTDTCGSHTSRSCPNPSQYINWDGVHLTETMYEAVSELFLDGTFCYPSFNYLLSKKQNRTGQVY